ncbi:serine hydrolase FSH [Catenaria anguillulae PL171]|uniref:Serine hydrolase FSH n=1 Tax=Catenaria anguillulae PL171 TaxID=765915 RepID=A0A1Y2HSQ3_9FUNG|nr:serine hydrolase FSH [Catenaria anguillulae PL171]
MSAPSGSKLRILCLHGYTQNATIFSKRTGVLRKFLKNRADLVYISAPHTPTLSIASPDTDPSSGDEGQCAWWNFDTESHPPIYAGFSDSMTVLKHALESQGPFDGILGFSQGAAMAGMLALTMHRDPTWTSHGPLKFVVCVSGFASRDPAHADAYVDTKVKCPTPSLHVWGLNDEWVTPDRSKALAEAFEGPSVYEHQGAHYVPMDAAGKAAVSEFLDKVVPKVE